MDSTDLVTAQGGRETPPCGGSKPCWDLGGLPAASGVGDCSVYSATEEQIGGPGGTHLPQFTSFLRFLFAVSSLQVTWVYTRAGFLV